VAGAVPGRGIVFWDAATGAETGRVDLESPAHGVRFDPHGATLAVVDARGLVHLIDRASGRRHTLHADALERSRQVECAFSSDGTRLAATSYGSPGGQQPVTVWEVATGRALGRFPGRDDHVG